ncbi:hypothetical protein PSAB6_180132 [Paraburkholderia sabiae]|nr:hypothetical protein PSAB6_180132 [Paraburkholderia sabiae]
MLRVNATSGGTTPDATSAPAMPATVASRMSGNALLVPVDSVSNGTPPQCAATARCVPSPPSTAISSTPSHTMCAVPACVSATESVMGRSTNSTSGQRSVLPVAACVSSARSSSAATPVRSRKVSTRSTPSAPSPAIRRTTILAFSAVGNTDACVVRRRMSRPDAGFAITPTVMGDGTEVVSDVFVDSGCFLRAIRTPLRVTSVTATAMPIFLRLRGERGAPCAQRLSRWKNGTAANTRSVA